MTKRDYFIVGFLAFAALAVGPVSQYVDLTKVATDIKFNTDNANDIGATAANRPRNVYIVGSIALGSHLIAGGVVQSGATSSFEVAGRSRMTSPSDGTMEFVNNAQSGFAATQSLYERWGSGSPEGVVTAPIGASYHRTNGGANTSLYQKESGVGNTGWIAK